MKRYLLLGAVGAVAIMAACSTESTDGGGAGPNGVNGSSNGSVPPGGKLPDGGFNDPPFEVPGCVTAVKDEADGGAGDTLEDDLGKATASVTGEGCTRTLTVDSTAQRKDNIPEGARTFEEKDRPSLQSGSVLFDSLYQLALEEAKECSVSAIKDYAFNEGKETSCGEGGCFETGRKWNYVWTRDLAYATSLGLAWVDPKRAQNSLEFKLSTRRDGSDLQIVQDTGTGGSYPVSTDRAVWALGASELLQHLTGEARTAFRDKALEAAKNTIAQDRAAIFDEADGLYRGEQSFLDWREQTYPGWTNPDVVNIGMSKSLSTNVAHLALIDLAATLAEETGDTALATTMAERATSLRKAIAARFWLPEDAQLSTFITTTLDPSPVRRFDLLGTSLAVLLGATSPAQSVDAIASYPTLPKGPPVVFPQQKETPIYHNRAIWPFVTAYWVKAAKKVNNDRAFERGIQSLVRGAALNLSNMENLEVESGAPWVEEGSTSGPVVNSQRQVWSVGGYIGMVNGSLFGIAPEKGGVRVQPYMTRGLRAMFPGTKKLALNDVTVRGVKMSVVINLPDDPKVDDGGAYAIKAIRFNSVPPEEGGFIADGRLKPRNLVEVDFDLPKAPAAKLKVITDAKTDYRSIFSPRTPSITSLSLQNGKVVVNADFTNEAPTEITWSVYRDGVRVASGLGAFTKSWTDNDTNGESTPSHCYSVETRWGSSGNLSQHAKPACFWSSDPSARIDTVGAGSFELKGGAISGDHTTNWGAETDELAATFTAKRTGAHLVQADYANGAGPINTGITCAVKHVTVEEQPSGNVVGEGYLMMPQRGNDWSSFGESSFVRVNLTSGKTYKVRLKHDGKSTNMSSFEHFAAYTGGLGGKDGTFFKVDVRSVKLLSLAP